MDEPTPLDFRAIEKKWQGEWSRSKLFEANVEETSAGNTSARPKFFITFPYPYVNGRMHIGHSYSLFRADVYARFKRMQGCNVLFPQGFHATGEPILGTIERLNKGDEAQLRTFTEGGATPEDIARFKKEGPAAVAKFWMQKWTEDLDASGVSIDWRRKFITTDLTPTYSRFIEWQYNTLRKKGYVVQGTHPVVYCPHDDSPTGDHDRLVGEGESPVEYALIKFPLQDSPKTFLVAATLRPETIYGITNMWVNPDEEYAQVKLHGVDEQWVVSPSAFMHLKDQLKPLTEVRTLKGSELIGKILTNPITKHPHPVLPASFVDASHASGLVTSVPSDAPYDYIALQDLKKNPSSLAAYPGLAEKVAAIKPISIITIPGYGEFPAFDACQKHGVKSQKDSEKLGKATSEIYKRGFHEGVMNENCGAFAGQTVQKAKEEISASLRKHGVADSLWDITGKVVCRCGTTCHVKILENQWFLKFSDEEWKEKVRGHIHEMKVYPQEARLQLLNTVDWLQNKACARRSGLGTKLPWDKTWIVETLSDSTIYMAYYTLSRIINEQKITPQQLPDAAFDYIFNEEGNPDAISKACGLSKETLDSLKLEFEYFYPVNLRTSGKDLLQNHLTFFLFHHAALFQRKHWPQGMAVNGYVNVQGEKMSKSKGNIISFWRLVTEHGADLARINIAASSEAMDDADWRNETLHTYARLFDFIHKNILSLPGLSSSQKASASGNRPELLLESRLSNSIKLATENFEVLKFRTACHHSLFESTDALKKYLVIRGQAADGKLVRKALETIVLMVSPFSPHYSEEMWKLLGSNGFASIAPFPKSDASKINQNLEESEELVSQVLGDVQSIFTLSKTEKPKQVVLYVAANWKHTLFTIALKDSKPKGFFDFEAVLKLAMPDSNVKARAKDVPLVLKSMSKAVNYYKDKPIPQLDEFAVLDSYAKGEFKTRFAYPFVVVREEDATPATDPKGKASKALPLKPAIYVE